MIYRANKKLDRVQFNLPIDFLAFTRFFAFKYVVASETKVIDTEMIAYDAFFRVKQFILGLLKNGFGAHWYGCEQMDQRFNLRHECI
jgi:hypothetical protein